MQEKEKWAMCVWEAVSQAESSQCKGPEAGVGKRGGDEGRGGVMGGEGREGDPAEPRNHHELGPMEGPWQRRDRR